jgi:hypothetical protein
VVTKAAESRGQIDAVAEWSFDGHLPKERQKLFNETNALALLVTDHVALRGKLFTLSAFVVLCYNTPVLLAFFVRVAHGALSVFVSTPKKNGHLMVIRR